MINYNQQYKNDAIVTLQSASTHDLFDHNLTDNKLFYAVGQKTSNDLTEISSVERVSLYCIQQDAILNLNGGSITIKDDNRTIINININGLSNVQWNSVGTNFSPALTFTSADSNVRFDNFANLDGMTQYISDLEDQTNVLNFTATVTVPDDVECNYTTGAHSYIKGSNINILFDGNIKKGDVITVKRDNRQDVISTVLFDTDLAFSYFGMDNSSKLELIYKHNSVTPQPTTPTQPTQPTQPSIKQYPIEATLQNATIVTPQPTKSSTGAVSYYLDSEHTTIILKANSGYTFETDGSLTYTSSNNIDQQTITIKATHSGTVTINIPSDINWSIQNTFILKMGAVKNSLVKVTGGFTNIYKADYTSLLKFSHEYIIETSNGEAGPILSYDITPYVNNLIMLPFDVPSGEPSSIVVGNETFDTKLPTVDSNYLTVDLGKISVDEQYKNGFDYYQVKTRLMLPYTNMIDLDPKHVINKTVSIQYIVNVINGDTTINLFNDDLFYSNQINLASEIPLMSSATKGSQYAVINQLKTVFRNDINQAYIIIEQPTPILNSDYYPTNEKGLLKSYNGNVKATLLNNLPIDVNDNVSLQNLLQQGVKINGTQNN